MRIELLQRLDGKGEPEIFSADLWPLVSSLETVHLDEDGLPIVGTLVREGMVVIGKVGKSELFDESLKPNVLERNALELEELKERFGYLWYDASLYAGSEHEGVVTSAKLLGEPPNQVAVVEIDTGLKVGRLWS